MFIVDLLFNLSFLVALSIISGFFDNRWSSSRPIGAALQGILFGAVAMLGMVNPLVFDAGIVFDGRSVVISLCALFFGPIAATIAALMAIALRVYQGGAGAIMGVSVITASALIGVYFYYRRKMRNRKISSLFLLGFGLLVHIAMLALTFALPYQSAIAVLQRIGWAIITFYPLATILIGKILHDQEVKQLSVEALRKNESLFRSLAQTSPVGIFKLNALREITFVNDRWCEIFGIKCTQLSNIKFDSFVHSNDIEEVIGKWDESSKQDKTFSIEFRGKHTNNHSPWILGQFEPDIDEYGNITGYVGSVFDITERKNQEQQLKLWENIFQHTRMGIVLGVGTSTRIRICNPAFAELHGYRANELEGMSLLSLCAPQEHSRIDEQVSLAIQKGFHSFETWLIRKDGQQFPALVSLTSVLDSHGRAEHIIGNVQDVSERFEAERRLREERTRLASIIEGTNVGTWEWNVQTGNTKFNERWAEMIGYTQDEISPATIDTWLRFMHPEDTHHAMQVIHQHFDGEIDLYQSEFRMLHKDGHWVWVQDRGKVLQWTEDGKPFMMYGFYIDITERKRIEDVLKQNEIRLKEQNEEYQALNEELTEINERLRQSEIRLKVQNDEYLVLNEELKESNEQKSQINAELAKARQRAEESDRLKSAFLANMSHEIRTPMNAIVGFSEILLRPNIPEEKQSLYAEVLNASCNQLLGIINDVLDISKIETGQVVIHEGEVNINKILRGVQSLFLPNASNKKSKIKLSYGLPNEACMVRTDEAKLNQILSNLVSNSVKFTDKGEIEVGYKLTGDDLEFYVTDTGIGISPANQNIIFDRFRQAEMAPSRSYGGTGLGLSICKAYVELLKGQIWVESELGMGSKFSFTIPYKPMLQKVVPPLPAPGASYNFMSKTIMVAEDEPANFFYIKELLSSTGATIIHAPDGAKAVEMVSHTPEINIVLMDIKMPKMNGLEATKAIRNSGKGLPIIALTAYAMAGDKENCLAAGCSGYIPKPINKDDLLSLIDMYLNPNLP